jgi:phosphoesterase RecJ-like protein
MYAEAGRIKEIIDKAQKIVIVQADNPDGDSLGSALALEHILGDLGKEPHLYCGVDMPVYLRYLEGWDRVQTELPKQFDASVIVDASTMSLLEKLEQSGYKGALAGKPCLVLDHHAEVENEVPFAEVILNDHEGSSSAGELIYNLARQLEWPLSVPAQTCLMTAILGDTQGLSNQLARPRTYRAVADMIEAGVDRPSLEEARREAG